MLKLIDSSKGERVALGMVGGCSKDSVFFLELFVGVVQILIDNDESCTFLSACAWLIRMSINTASWREDAPNC